MEERLNHALDVAQRHAVDIDIVLLPEVALRAVELEAAVRVCRDRQCMLVCGVHVDGTHQASSMLPAGPANVAVFDHVGVTRLPAKALFTQRKHHRWCLDGSQIRQYGLEAWLPTTGNLWECAEVGVRELCFHTIHDWLTVATLVCEDLARQDPASDVLRAVGPNLVLALLMDGPQIAGRWPERYATVLADDPGSSVLTVTSLGMSALTQKHAKARGWTDHSRAIALWKDVEHKAVIELAEGEDAAILHIVNKRRTEYTADGREDGGVASFPTLAGWTPLTIGEPVQSDHDAAE